MKCEGVLWERLLDPFLLAALNLQPDIGSAALAGAIVRETLAKGGRYYYPRIAEPHLASALVDPALAYLKAKGASVRFGQRVRKLTLSEGRIAALDVAKRHSWAQKIRLCWLCRPGSRRSFCRASKPLPNIVPS